jgi:phenylalanyl-tRNA synthetase beta subunit
MTGAEQSAVDPAGDAAATGRAGRLERFEETLVQRGFQEAITYSFVDPDFQQRLDPEREPLALANPISADLAVMRTSLWPGLLKALIYNQKRQQTRVRLFEHGLNFIPEGGALRQEPYLGGVITGSALPEQWGVPARPADFFDLKADVEALLALTGEPEASPLSLRPSGVASRPKRPHRPGWGADRLAGDAASPSRAGPGCGRRRLCL